MRIWRSATRNHPLARLRENSSAEERRTSIRIHLLGIQTYRLMDRLPEHLQSTSMFFHHLNRGWGRNQHPLRRSLAKRVERHGYFERSKAYQTFNSIRLVRGVERSTGMRIEDAT